MEKRLLTTLAALMGVFVYANAQISVRTEGKAELAQQEEVVAYDSLSNFNFRYDLTDNYKTKQQALNELKRKFKQFVGQRIYFRPLPHKGYSYNESIDQLRGKYYTIKNFTFIVEQLSYSDSYQLDTVVFNLQNDKGNTYKCKVSAHRLEFNDFAYEDALLVGYYEKLKQRFVGKSFIYTTRAEKLSYGDVRYTHAKRFDSYEEVEFHEGEEWMCTDIQLVDDDFYMPLYAILTNSNGKEIMICLEDNNRTGKKAVIPHIPGVMEKSEYITLKDTLVKKFGPENAQIIIEQKVRIGMTDEMCLESWGKPEKINRTIVRGATSEQWVYDINTYLYFRKGVLTSIQN